MSRRLTIGWNKPANAPHLGLPRGLTVRGDVWLAGEGEKRELAQALANALGVKPESVWPLFESNTLLHRIPSQHREFAVETWAHGLRLGVAEVLPTGEWTFYPSGATASLLLSMGLQPASIDSPRRGRLKGKRVELSPCLTGGPYALVRVGGYAGVVRRVEGCTFKVKDLAPEGFKLLPRSGIEEAVRVNRAWIERLAAEAVEFIRRETRPGETVYVAVSGGADSTAAAGLAVEALGPERVRLVYADTGMEFPESRETVERLAERLGVELDIVTSGQDPVELIARRGLMSRDDRWCTRTLKLAPLRRYYKHRGARIVVDGVRALESNVRATLPRAGVNPVIPFVRRILPILHWTRLEVQLYIALRRLPMNPLYQRGLSRIGCIVCPAMALHELRLASKLHPGFYERLARTISPGDPEAGLEILLKGAWRRAKRGARGSSGPEA